jgi:hypothetical protein
VRKGGITGRCTVCRHAERARIDYLCSQGGPLLPIAKRFGLGDDALRRHFARHVALDYKAAIKAGPFGSEEQLRKLAAEGGASVLENLRAIYGGLASRWLTAFECGDDATLALLTGRMHNNLTMQARLTHELMPAPANVTNLFLSPQFTDLQATLIGALRNFPEARRAVVSALRERERTPPMIEGRADDEERAA